MVAQFLVKLQNKLRLIALVLSASELSSKPASGNSIASADSGNGSGDGGYVPATLPTYRGLKFIALLHDVQNTLNRVCV